MELKTARLTLLIDPNKKAAFERLCAHQDRTPSQVVRQLIREYLSQHEVSYIGSGAAAAAAPGPVGNQAPSFKQAVPRRAPPPLPKTSAKRPKA